MAISVSEQGKDLKTGIQQQASEVRQAISSEAEQAKKAYASPPSIAIGGSTTTPTMNYSQLVNKTISGWEKEQTKTLSREQEIAVSSIDAEVSRLKEETAGLRAEASKELNAWLGLHVEVSPGEFVLKTDWNKLSSAQQKQFKETGQYTVEPSAKEAKAYFKKLKASGDVPKEAVYKGYSNGQLKYEVPGTTATEQVYEVDTPSGTETVKKSTWESMSNYDKLEMMLGRAPSAAELTSFVSGESPAVLPSWMTGDIPGTGWLHSIPGYDWVDRTVTGLASNFVLGTEILIPGEQSAAERHYWETLPSVREAMREYKQKAYSGSSALEAQSRLALEVIGIPAVRVTSPKVSAGDIGTMEWISSGVNIAAISAPFWVPPVIKFTKATLPGGNVSGLSTTPIETTGVKGGFAGAEQPLVDLNIPGLPKPSIEVPTQVAMADRNISGLKWSGDFTITETPTVLWGSKTPVYIRTFQTKPLDFFEGFSLDKSVPGLWTPEPLTPAMVSSNIGKVPTGSLGSGTGSLPSTATMTPSQVERALSGGYSPLLSPAVTPTVRVISGAGGSPLAFPFVIPAIAPTVSPAAPGISPISVPGSTDLPVTSITETSLPEFSTPGDFDVSVPSILNVPSVLNLPGTSEGIETSFEVSPQVFSLPFTQVKTLTTTTISEGAPGDEGGKGIFGFPFGGGGGDRKKSFKDILGIDIEAISGSTPALFLHMPTPLSKIDRPFTPRPIMGRKVTRIVRKKKIPVAGFREVR